MKNIVWWAIEIVLTIANLAVTFYITKIVIAIQKIFTFCGSDKYNHHQDSCQNQTYECLQNKLQP